MAGHGRAMVAALMEAVAHGSRGCPCHSHSYGGITAHMPKGLAGRSRTAVTESSEHANREYAFEMASSNIRYGPGVTKEVGMDFKNLGCKKVLVVTDPKIAKMAPAFTALSALESAGVPYIVYDRVSVEPTDTSFRDMINFARSSDFDAILAVGGGSTMDTAKAANLFKCYPDADLLDL
eukprot:Opistho-2@73197